MSSCKDCFISYVVFILKTVCWVTQSSMLNMIPSSHLRTHLIPGSQMTPQSGSSKPGGCMPLKNVWINALLKYHSWVGYVAFWSCVPSSSKEPGQQRVKRWAFGINEVLKDPVGREQFLKFLESEFSSENLRYVMSYDLWHLLEINFI